MSRVGKLDARHQRPGGAALAGAVADAHVLDARRKVSAGDVEVGEEGLVVVPVRYAGLFELALDDLLASIRPLGPRLSNPCGDDNDSRFDVKARCTCRT